MNIVNVMWSGGPQYTSIHTVHRQVLGHAPADVRVSNWLLLGEQGCGGLGETRTWNLPQRALKGRMPERLMVPWLRLRLRAALRQAQPDVLLLDGLGVARLMLPLLRQLPGVRAAVLFHGSTRLRGSDISLLRSMPRERLSIAAVSGTLARSLEQELGLPVRTLRIAMDPTVFCGQLLARNAARQTLGLPAQDEGRVLCAVGRLVESKGFEMLIEAFARAREHQPNLHLMIFGDGELRDRLAARIQALGLDASVRLCGYRPDISQLYRAFDGLLLPSRSEGLGLVLQEAVLADIPVICSDLAVFREQLGEVDCYLPVADVEAWSQAIARCASFDPQATAAAQRRSLAPEQGWQAFLAGVASLLGR